MANENKNRSDQKRGFPTTFFLLLLAVVLVIITVQNFMTTKRAKVSFSHQVEHLVNLNLIVPEDSRKVSLNDNLVSFSGRFRERETEEGKRRFKYLELLEKNHTLMAEREDVVDDLSRQRAKVEDAIVWFLQISGTPIPAGGYRVLDESIDLPSQKSTLVVYELPRRDMVNLQM